MIRKVKKKKNPKKKLIKEKSPTKEKKSKVKKVKGRYVITSGKKTIERNELKVYRVNIKERRSAG